MYKFNPLLAGKLDRVGVEKLGDLDNVSTLGTANGYVLTYGTTLDTWTPKAAGAGDMLRSVFVTGAGTVYNASRLEGETLATVQAHTVDAMNIAGTIGDANIPDVETLSYTVPFADAQIPTLDATKIISGTFDSAQIPALPTSRIANGTFVADRIPTMANLKGTVPDGKIPDVETLSYGAAFATAQIPSLGAYKVASGTFGLARIPALTTSHITTGTFNLNRIPSMDDAHIPDVDTLSYSAAFATAQIPAIGAYKINAGTLVVARHETLNNLNGTVALTQIPSMDDWHIPNVEGLSYSGAFATAQIPSLSASKITSGSFNANRIPILPAARITTGTFSLDRIPSVDDARIPDLETLSYGGAFGTAQIPAVGAYKTASGTLGAARIPYLPTSKITTGTFGLARIPAVDDARIPNLETLSYGAAFATGQIPNLAASKTTSGTFNANRIPTLPTNRYGSAVLLTGAQSIGGTKTFTDIPILPASDPTADNEAARKAYVDAQVEYHPYIGDETQVDTVSGTYQDIKNFHFVKHGSVVSPSTIRVACELKTTAGSYQMQIIVGSGTALTFSGTESAYKLRYGDYGLGAAATGVVETRAKLRNIGAGTSYNRLYDNYLRY